ncbi:hypothetical protein PSYPI_10635 [Pseudomonas syringae pv. pisi str. 1704B]|uniref:Uncharacterized protein n=1 Tax=Pseudomonas syringae pv. pisi str. 1704B TaxID=629263 RepID=F3G6X8_PSESJ|nr:hypothetical protein PSYPI_10635 [Pseudomonas syringae pv. pisi str. 1704B]
MKHGLNHRDIGIDQVIKQAGLLGILLLAALGKLQTLELGDLMGQFSITVWSPLIFLPVVSNCDSNRAAKARIWSGDI